MVGQSGISTLTLLTHTVYTNKVVSHRHAAVHAYVMHHGYTLIYGHKRQFVMRFLLGFRSFVFSWRHSHKQVLFKVSRKVPPSSLAKGIVQVVGISLSSPLSLLFTFGFFLFVF